MVEKLKATGKAETYKDKKNKFNKSLNELPEHYDIPKVGPG